MKIPQSPLYLDLSDGGDNMEDNAEVLMEDTPYRNKSPNPKGRGTYVPPCTPVSLVSFPTLGIPGVPSGFSGFRNLGGFGAFGSTECPTKVEEQVKIVKEMVASFVFAQGVLEKKVDTLQVSVDNLTTLVTDLKREFKELHGHVTGSQEQILKRIEEVAFEVVEEDPNNTNHTS